VSFYTPEGICTVCHFDVIIACYLEVQSARYLGFPECVGVTSCGTLAPVGEKHFNQYLCKELHSGLVRPHVPKDSRGYRKRLVEPSEFYKRAKLGFVYWCRDPVMVTYGECRSAYASINATL